MKRRHLFEFGDQPWLPAFLRDAMTDYLALVYRLSPLPGVWAEVIERILKATGSEEIVDLCSGSGGPMSLVVAELRRPVPMRGVPESLPYLIDMPLPGESR